MGRDIAAMITRDGRVWYLEDSSMHSKIERAFRLRTPRPGQSDIDMLAAVNYSTRRGLDYFTPETYELRVTDQQSGWIRQYPDMLAEAADQLDRELRRRLAMEEIPVSQELRLDRWPEATIPRMRVRHNLYLQYSQLERLRDDMNINGRLDLYGCRKMAKLPAGLWLGWGDLHIEHTDITELPADLHCNRIWCEGSLLCYIPKTIKVPVYGMPRRQAAPMVDERIDGEIIDYPHAKWYPLEYFPLRHMTPLEELEAWDIRMTEEPGGPQSELREEMRQTYGKKLNRPNWARRR